MRRAASTRWRAPSTGRWVRVFVSLFLSLCLCVNRRVLGGRLIPSLTHHIHNVHPQVVSVAEAFAGEHLSLHGRVGMTTDNGQPPFCWSKHPGALCVFCLKMIQGCGGDDDEATMDGGGDGPPYSDIVFICTQQPPPSLQSLPAAWAGPTATISSGRSSGASICLVVDRSNPTHGSSPIRPSIAFPT